MFRLKDKYQSRSFWILFTILCSLVIIFIHNILIDLVVLSVHHPTTTTLDEQFVPIPQSSELFQHNNDESNEKLKRLPQVIIIGSRKSGTRALLRFLEVNRQVRSAKQEVHFFDKQANFKRGLDWYRSQMPETSVNEITIEKSPAYFVTHQAPERIKAMNSSIKLVLILRNPVTRLISDFSQLIANRIDRSAVVDDDEHDEYYYSPPLEPAGANSNSGGGYRIVNNPEPKGSGINQSRLADSIWHEAEKEFENYVLRFDGGIDEQRQAVRIGMYSSHLERWLALFSRDQFHFVDGEQLILKPHEELQKLEHFLGLRPVIRREDFVFNPRKGFYCLAAATNSTQTRATEEFKKIEHNSNRTPELQSTTQNDDKPTKVNENEPICLSKTKGRRHVKVAKQLIEQLQDFYAPYNEYLFSLTGINFNNQ